ncbi:MAG: hypothetical protein V4488_22690 [Pseudomonadota bacterium]
MRLLDLIIGASPRTPGYARATGVIAPDQGQEMRIWVDVPEEMAADLSDNGNPWLAAMLPMAAAAHEDIQLSLPVDALLLENLRGVSRIWAGWYPELDVVGLDAVGLDCASCAAAAPPPPDRTAAFFSGGIDSYYTIARRLPGNDAGLPVVGRVDELLSVWGFDVSVNDQAGFAPMAQLLESAAEQIQRSHAIIHTNLRDNRTVWQRRWGPLTNGAGLSFVALMLEKRYRQVFLGSSYPNYTGVPWGSHPLVDPLFSTSAMQIVHDGASSTRVAKTDLVARFLPAQSALHVCQAMAESNCSECEKCYRTMITIDILGHRQAMAQVFDWSRYDVAAIKNLSIGGVRDGIFYDEIIAAARAAGRHDVLRGLLRARARSRLLYPALQISDWLMKMPFLWRAGSALKKIMQHGTIRQDYIEHPNAPSEH